MSRKIGRYEIGDTAGWDESEVLAAMAKKDRAEAAYDTAMRGKAGGKGEDNMSNMRGYPVVDAPRYGDFRTPATYRTPGAFRSVRVPLAGEEVQGYPVSDPSTTSGYRTPATYRTVGAFRSFHVPMMGWDFVGQGKPTFDAKTDKKVLAAIKATGVPMGAGSILTVQSAQKLADAVAKAFDGDANKAGTWLMGYLERLQISWMLPDGSMRAYRGGRVFTAAPPAPADTKVKTSTMHGDEVGKGKGGYITDPNSTAGQAKFLTMAATNAGPRVAQIAAKFGLVGKPHWSAADRDRIASVLMGDMMKASGRPPSKWDAKTAREVVKIFGGSRGVMVAGESDMGSFWKYTNPLWLTGKVVQGVGWGVQKLGQGTKWVGKKMSGGGGGGKGGGGAPAGGAGAIQIKRAQLVAAAKRRAAAKARILAAERKHEASILQREEARRAAQEDQKAAEAEAAANEAEAIAIEAEALQDVADTEAVAGIGFWSAVGNVEVSVGKAAQVAASPTPAGQKVRTGAAAVQSAKNDPAIAAHGEKVAAKASAGNKGAQQAVKQMKAGAVASAQKVDALQRDALLKRRRATTLAILMLIPVSAVQTEVGWVLRNRRGYTLGAGPGKPFCFPTKEAAVAWAKKEVERLEKAQANVVLGSAPVTTTAIANKVLGDELGRWRHNRRKRITAKVNALAQLLNDAGLQTAPGSRWDNAMSRKAVQIISEKVTRGKKRGARRLLKLYVKKHGISTQDRQGKWHERKAPAPTGVRGSLVTFKPAA